MLTATVVTVKVPVVAPAAMDTVAGTFALESLLERATLAPPVGAELLSVTVPVEEEPPVTVVGLSVSVVRVGVGALTVSVAVAFAPPKVAVITGLFVVATAVVVIVNEPVVAPAPTVIVPGTEALGSLLVREMLAPPVGAGPLSVTVPVEEFVPITLVGFKASPDALTPVLAVMVRVAVLLAPP